MKGEKFGSARNAEGGNSPPAYDRLSAHSIHGPYGTVKRPSSFVLTFFSQPKTASSTGETKTPLVFKSATAR